MAKEPRFAPASSVRHLTEWAEADPQGRDDTPILQAYSSAWIGGLRQPPSLMPCSDDVPPYIRILLAKPRKEGETFRDLDVEGFALILTLCIPGGRAVIDPQGPENSFYYTRLCIDKPAAQKEHRRVSVLSLIADAPDRAVEPRDYHDLRRAALGHRPSVKFKEKVTLGAVQAATGYALERFREVVALKPQAFPPDFDEGRYAALLGAMHARLVALPLGGGGD